MKTLILLLAMPLGLGLVAGFVGLGLRRRWPLVLGLALLLGFSLPATGRFLMGTLESATPRPVSTPLPVVNTAVVLGGYLRNDPGHPEGGDALIYSRAERFMRGLQLLEEGRIRRLILCAGPAGRNGPDPQPSEGERARREALRRGFPPGKILLAPAAANTRQEARVIREMMGADAGFPIILVTSAFHMPRAAMLFREEGLEVIPYPCDYHVYSSRPPDGWRMSDWIPSAEGLYHSSLALKELYGMAFYRFIDLWRRKDHP